jgi:hypothetical protein
VPLALLVKSFAEIVSTMSSITCFIIANAAGACGCGCCGDVGSGIWVAVDIIASCEQVALLAGWVHIRFCGCGVGDDVTAAAAAANVPSVKMRTTATTIAARVLIMAVLFTCLKRHVYIFDLGKLMLTYLR